MTIEKLGDMQIAYMRRTGGYGEGNRQLMEQFKRYLREHALLQEDTTILGIALDDPAQIPEDRQRYDVGMILTGREDPCGLPVRTVAGGRWAVFEVPQYRRGRVRFLGRPSPTRSTAACGRHETHPRTICASEGLSAYL